MIHDEICTYEVSLLAKVKGFPQAFNYTHFKSGLDYYNHKGELNGDVGDILKLRIKHKPIPDDMQPIAAPTQSLLQRWLREEKGYYVYPYFDNVQLKWDWVCREKKGDKWIPLVVYDFHLFSTYELALENALKYTLENLIKSETKYLSNMIEEVKVAAVLNADRRLAEIPKLDYAISAKADYDNGLTTGFVDGAEWGYNKAIANVCGWLKSNAHFCVSEFTGTLDEERLVQMLKIEMARKSEKTSVNYERVL